MCGKPRQPAGLETPAMTGLGPPGAREAALASARSLLAGFLPDMCGAEVPVAAASMSGRMASIHSQHPKRLVSKVQRKFAAVKLSAAQLSATPALRMAQ